MMDRFSFLPLPAGERAGVRGDLSRNPARRACRAVASSRRREPPSTCLEIPLIFIWRATLRGAVFRFWDRFYTNPLNSSTNRSKRCKAVCTGSGEVMSTPASRNCSRGNLLPPDFKKVR